MKPRLLINYKKLIINYYVGNYIIFSRNQSDIYKLMERLKKGDNYNFEMRYEISSYEFNGFDIYNIKE